MRTFVAIARTGRFRDAAAELAITQQAVSKRMAALEKDLGVRLLTRTARGAEPTVDGQALLPHARDLLRSEARAIASVRPGRRALRVDVIGRRLAPAGLLRDFRRAHPEVELDVVTLFDAGAAFDAIRSGTLDASIRAVGAPGGRLPDDLAAARAYDEPIQLLTGPFHALADAGAVAPAELAGRRIWMPGIAPGTEWAAYYDALAAAFGLTIEVTGSDFGAEPLLDTLAPSRSLATLVGERTILSWPDGGGLRRIALREPSPCYPHSLVWHPDNAHPALAALLDHLCTGRYGHGGPGGHGAPGTWTPDWARLQDSGVKRR